MIHVQDKILPVKRLAGKEVRTIQVRHSGNATAARDMRKQLHIFVVEEDICVGKSKAKANKKYGDGGATQYYIRDMDKSKLTSTGKLRSFRR